jgi:hypothetical protein
VYCSVKVSVKIFVVGLGLEDMVSTKVRVGYCDIGLVQVE